MRCNLLRELVAAGHDVTMISQYRGDAFGKRVYGGGPPPDGAGRAGDRARAARRAGRRRFRARRRRRCATTVLAEHARAPFDILHAQYGYPCGWAAMLASRDTRGAERGLDPGRRRPLGRQLLRDAPAGDDAGAGPCRRGADRLRLVPRRGGRAARHRPRAVHHRAGRGGHAPVHAGRAGRRTRRSCCTTAGSTRGKACSTCWRRRGMLRASGDRFRLLISGIGPTFDETAAAHRAAGARRIASR